ncbi:MAG: T9SS type A sorting domain-containing protein, partial [Chitinophagales bacterium]
FRLYPNPTEDVLYVNFEDIAVENLRLNVYNILGEEIYSQESIETEELRINTNQWSTGVYTVRVYNENDYISKKVIKK